MQILKSKLIHKIIVLTSSLFLLAIIIYVANNHVRFSGGPNQAGQVAGVTSPTTGYKFCDDPGSKDQASCTGFIRYAAAAVPSPYQNVNGPVTISGALSQSGNYAYLGAYNSGTPAYPREGHDLAIAWNFTNGGRDVSFWNTDTANTGGTSFAFRQLTEESSRRDLLTILANGNVGIGTVGPVAKLSILQGSTSTNESSSLVVYGGSTTATVGSYSYPAEIQTTNSNLGRLQFAGYRKYNPTNDWAGAGFRIQYGIDNSFTDGSLSYIYLGTGNGYNGQVAFGTGGTERMTIDNTGNVGIGTANPNQKLEVLTANDATQGIRITNTGLNGGGWIGQPYQSSLYMAGNTYWNGGAWVKINPSEGGAMIANLGGRYYDTRFCYMTNTESTYTCVAKIERASAAVFQYGTTTGAVDVAELYLFGDNTNLNKAEGDIIEAQNDKDLRVQRSKQSYSKTVIGIVSTKPGLLLGNEDAKNLDSLPDPNKPQLSAPSKNLENSKAVALAGRVPTKVTSFNGNITPGDPITSSSLPGIGMKATKPGPIVAKALESTENWNDQNCPAVSSLDNINWPKDDGTNSAKPCFRLPDGTYAGKIMTLLNISWYDPDVNLTSTDNFHLDFDQLKDAGNNLTTRIGAFGKLIVGKIQAGIIETQKLIVNGVDILDKLNKQEQEIAGLKATVQQLQQQLQSR